ncbi:hypothetical protein BH23VER1_BH23VER1_08470 [soil metagenome]
MKRKRYHTNIFVSLLVLGVPLLFHCTAGAHVPSHSILSGDPSTIQGDGDGTDPGSRLNIRATAYTHTEADHLKYGRKSAAGTTLRSGAITSAAADWSKFPMGTKFKIAGLDETYVVDDYGSALVGKDVIDLYRTSKGKMNEWGARMVDIEVVEWGDFDASLKMLKPRAKYSPAVRQMIEGLKAREREEKGASNQG